MLPRHWLCAPAYFRRLVAEYTELFDGGTLVIHDAMNLVVDHAVRDVLLNLTTTAEASCSTAYHTRVHCIVA